MPEGDTVWLTASRLDSALSGRVLTVADLRVPALATVDLTGRTVTAVQARGKHVLMRLDDARTLHSHLRMDGSWQIAHAGQRGPARRAHELRVLLGNTEWVAQGYRIHDLALIETTREHELVGHLGPDLLGNDWDEDEALRRLRAHPDRAIGEALLDQRAVAGIGNLYKSEVLFIERVDPFRPVAGVANLVDLLRRARALLRQNRDHHQQSTTGYLGRGREHWVYRRAGEPCLRCRTPILRAMQGMPPNERSTYWCPRCQQQQHQPSG